MYEDLQEAWITHYYKSLHSILLPSVNKQLSRSGLILDLESLPKHPIAFKELFIRWLISINRDRLKKKQEVIVTRELILKCPLWKIVKVPFKHIDLTREKMFNKPTPSVGTIGTKQPTKGINNLS